MTSPTLTDELLEFTLRGDVAAWREAVDSVHPAEIADFIADLGEDDVWRLLAEISPRQAADIFSHLELERQTELAGSASRRSFARMLEALPPDDRADLVQCLETEFVEQILPLIARAEREDIRRLSSYPEGTAGALMSSDYAALRADVSILQAIEQIRCQAPTRETIYYIYVVDGEHRLIAFVSLRDLILADAKQTVRDIMHEDVISVDVGEDQEEVARNIEKYDLLAIPVTNGNRKLIGIITHDDAMDVIRQEQQEDVELLMAISGRHETGEYLRMPAVTHFRNRVAWVVILGVFGLVSGFIVQSFEGLLAQVTILAAFMPMLADTGGNTGSQSATLVIRALALGEVHPRDILRILGKEFQVAIMLASVLAFLTYGRVLLLGGRFSGGPSLSRIAWAISLALGLQVISATLIGAILPLLASKLKCDPAVVASPALTTVVDMTGLLLFFGTAKLLLGV